MGNEIKVNSNKSTFTDAKKNNLENSKEPNLAYIVTNLFIKHDEISNKKAQELIDGANELRQKISEFLVHRSQVKSDLSKIEKDIDYSDNPVICKFIDDVNEMTGSRIGKVKEGEKNENRKYRHHCLDKEDLEELIRAVDLLIPQMEQNANLKLMEYEPTLMNLVYEAKMAHDILRDINVLLETINRNSVRS